jgi:myo-inositol 2-dehydrogenase / D-chiro-inositol 1-dehydrogenase
MSTSSTEPWIGPFRGPARSVGPASPARLHCAEVSPAPLRVAVVGLGLVAQVVYLPLLARRRDLFEVIALCELSAELREAIGERIGVPPERRSGSLGDLLDADDVDGVLLLTSGSHGAAAHAILEAGFPVLCEKPLCFTIAEADQLVGRPLLQLGYMKLFDPALERARDLVSGWGLPRSVEVVVLHPPIETQLRHAPQSVLVPDDRGPAPDETALLRIALGPAAVRLGDLYANVLLGSVVHDLAVVRSLVADPTAMDHADTWGGAPGSVALEGCIGDETRFSLRWHYLEHRAAYRESVAVHFEDADVELVFPSPFHLHASTELVITKPQAGAERRAVWRSPAEAFERQLEAWHHAVTSSTIPLVGAVEGRTDIGTCQRAVALLSRRLGVPIGGEAAGP